MLEGVERLALPGVPGTLTVFGPEAFPVVSAPSGGRPAPLVGAARLGRGRAVLFGHGYFGDALAEGDTARFVANALRWAARDPGTVRVGVRGRNALAAHLPAGFSVVALDGDAWTARLAEVDVAVLPLADLRAEEVEAVGARVRAGLGVAGGMPGWGWRQLNPGKDLATENAGNRLLAPAGLVWGEETVEKPADGLLRVEGPASPMTHAGLALDALLAKAEGRTLSAADSALAVATVARAVREVPPADDLFRPRLARLLAKARDLGGVPTAEQPLTDDDGLAKVLLTAEIQRDRALPPRRVSAHPAAAAFPGEVPTGAPRVARRVAVDLGVPDWRSTGLYAPPGETLVVRVPLERAGEGLRLRIGAHTDLLWGHARWQRAPEVTVERPLDAPETHHASAFGGLVYVVVPRDGGVGVVEVEVRGAVEAPRFALGETSAEGWRRIRERPAPWAEVGTSKVVITVPSEHVRSLEDPEALLRWWDRVMDGCADLAAIPRERRRPERYVADVQISAGLGAASA
jgi:hypothetical protein